MRILANPCKQRIVTRQVYKSARKRKSSLTCPGPSYRVPERHMILTRDISSSTVWTYKAMLGIASLTLCVSTCLVQATISPRII